MILERYRHRSALLVGALLVFGRLLAGCSGQNQATSSDPKLLQSHKLQPPIPSAVPHGMNK